MIPVETVKERLTVPQILSRYGYPINNKRRIPCPIHNGSDNNFAYTDQFYKCFVCGASGDVVKLVQELHGINFKQAMMRIALDFGFTDEPQAAAPVRKKSEREQLIEDRDAVKAAYWTLYHDLEVKKEKEGLTDEVIDGYGRLMELKGRLFWLGYKIETG